MELALRNRNKKGHLKVAPQIRPPRFERGTFGSGGQLRVFSSGTRMQGLTVLTGLLTSRCVLAVITRYKGVQLALGWICMGDSPKSSQFLSCPSRFSIAATGQLRARKS